MKNGYLLSSHLFDIADRSAGGAGGSLPFVLDSKYIVLQLRIIDEECLSSI